MRGRLVEEKGADPPRVHVIHNWADCEAIVPGPKDNGFSREHGLGDRFVVMHSGNVGLSQNLEVAIEAAARLLALHPQLAAWMMPPSNWLRAPSGLMIRPASAAHQIRLSRTVCSTSTSATTAAYADRPL